MKRLPQYLRRPIIDTEKTKTVRHVLKENRLNTVCEGARCPNKNECYQHNTATFLIMGNVCTRNCKYCNITSSKPERLDEEEPKNIAKAVSELGLRYVVITSVTRDDIEDGGASHFAKCIEEIRALSDDVRVEILTPDFKRKGSVGEFNRESLDRIIEAKPDVFNHNIETVRDVFEKARPLGNYDLSLSVLEYVKKNSDIPTKSGFMIGLGETTEQIVDTMRDLRGVDCDMLTIGQYIRPSKQHLEVEKYYLLEEYDYLREKAKELGFRKYQIGALVRSSYHAKDLCCGDTNSVVK